MSDEAVLEICGLAHDGRGVARLGGLAVFVSGALPGMRAVCRLTARKRNLAEAVALEIIRPLKDPAASCPHAGSCGGCPLMAMPYQEQLLWKERLLRDAMLRIGRIGPAELDSAWQGISPSPAIRAMRNKMEFAFAGAGSGLVLGLRKAASHVVTPTPGCLLMPPEAGEIVGRIRNIAARRGLCAQDGHGKGLLRELTLRRGFTPHGNSMRYFALLLTGPCDREAEAAIRDLAHELMLSKPGVAGFAHEAWHGRGHAPHGGKRVFSLGETTLELPLAGRRYRLDISSFFQVNTASAQILAGQAKSLPAPACGGSLLDLFCGVGAPGQSLAGHFDSLLGIERDARAIAMARINARNAGLDSCRYRVGDAQGALAGPGPRHACALVDPPRAGLGAGLVRSLRDRRPMSIIYISCNPATLARDIGALSGCFRLRELSAVDMFPHTAHAECVALLDAVDAP